MLRLASQAKVSGDRLWNSSAGAVAGTCSGAHADILAASSLPAFFGCYGPGERSRHMSAFHPMRTPHIRQ